MDFASVCVVMVSLIFTGMAVLVEMNVNRIVKDIEKTNEIVIFLKEDTSDEDIDIINQKLSMMSNISSVTFYSKEEAFSDLKSGMTGYEDVFESLGDESPLVDTFRVKVSDTSIIADTVETIELFDHIELISAPYDFANILTQIKKLVSKVSVIVIAAMLIVSMVIISNSTRASVFARRKEISIMKYVGATNTFIRIPFFIEGMITGLIAGGIAFLIAMFAYNSLLGILTQDLYMWVVIGSGGLIPFESVAFKLLIVYLGAGMIVGSLGSVISTKKYLNV